MKSFSYRVIQEYNLNFERFRGEFTVNDLFDYKRQEFADSGYLTTNNLLSDIRECHFDVSDEDLTLYMQYIHGFKGQFKHKRVAFITDSPNQVLWVNLMVMQKLDLDLMFNVFSTIASALRWVGVPFELVDELQLLEDKGFIER